MAAQQQQPAFYGCGGNSTELAVVLCGSVFKLCTADERMLLMPFKPYPFPRELEELKEQLRGRFVMSVTRVNLRQVRSALDEHRELRCELQRLVAAAVHSLVNLLRELGGVLEAKSPRTVCIFETKNRPLYDYEREHHGSPYVVMETVKFLLNLSADREYPHPAVCERQINKPYSLRAFQQVSLFLRMLSCSHDLPALAHDLDRHSLRFALHHRRPLGPQPEEEAAESTPVLQPSTYLLQHGAPLFQGPHTRAALLSLPPMSPLVYHRHSPFRRHQQHHQHVPWHHLKLPYEDYAAGAAPAFTASTAAALCTSVVTATTTTTAAALRPVLLLRRPPLQPLPLQQTPRRSSFRSSLLLPPPPPGFEHVRPSRRAPPPVGEQPRRCQSAYVNDGECVEPPNDDPFPAERVQDLEEDELLLRIVRELLSHLPLDARGGYEHVGFYSRVTGTLLPPADPFRCAHRDSLRALKVSDRVPCWYCAPHQRQSRQALVDRWSRHPDTSHIVPSPHRDREDSDSSSGGSGSSSNGEDASSRSRLSVTARPFVPKALVSTSPW